MQWLFREVKRLATTLRDEGVAEDRVRSACHSFISGLAYGLDTEPIDVHGVRYDIGLIAIGPSGHAITATDRFLLHEMSSSIVDEVLDNP